MFTSSGKAFFDKSLEKATSQQLLEPDWDSILAVCDSIRQGDVKAKYAMDVIKKKVAQENPNVGKFGLQVLESVVKNCGAPVHQEIATKESMEFLKDLARAPKTAELIKFKILELIQAWSHAFRNESSYRIVQDTYNLMKMEGCTFPEFKDSDAMFAAELAPEWKDGDNCFACHTAFSTFIRKHHCRRCGQIFCSKCSATNSTIPALGIEKEVRVCEACYNKLRKLPDATSKDTELPAAYLASPLSKQAQTPPKKKEDELREEEELALALALSQSEAEAKESEKKKFTASWSSQPAVAKDERFAEAKPSEVVLTSAPKFEIDDGLSPELARYLNRNYWERKQQVGLVKTGYTPAPAAAAQVTQPSAPEATQAEPRNAVVANFSETPAQNGVSDGAATIDEEFLQVLSSSVDVFVNRMRSDSQRGRSIASDSSVQTLFEALQSMHPKLLGYMHGQEDQRAHHESLQDKLSQLRDARDALGALRDEHAERRRREAEERERLRQVQMAHKLDAMRKKKHEYLAQQRQLALQKMQEQERELQARLEQQKQLAIMRQAQLHGFPQELQPGYAGSNYATGQSSGMYYAVMPGGGMYTPAVLPEVAGLPYQQQQAMLASAGSGSYGGEPGWGVGGWQMAQQHPQQQLSYAGSGPGQLSQQQQSDAVYRMHEMASTLPPASSAYGPGSYGSYPMGHAVGVSGMYQEPGSSAAYQTQAVGGGGQLADAGYQNGSNMQAYQAPYYAALPMAQQQQQPAFQQQLQHSFQQPAQQQPAQQQPAQQQPAQQQPAQQQQVFQQQQQQYSDNQLIVFD